jgi:hypothetical protein
MTHNSSIDNLKIVTKKSNSISMKSNKSRTSPSVPISTKNLQAWKPNLSKRSPFKTGYDNNFLLWKDKSHKTQKNSQATPTNNKSKKTSKPKPINSSSSKA